MSGLVVEFLFAEVGWFADSVVLVLLFVAALALNTLGEIVVGAALASPSLFREFKAPSVSHALSHVLFDQISGCARLLFGSLGRLGGGSRSEVRDSAHVHALSLDRGSKGVVLFKNSRPELIASRCVLSLRPVIIV